MTYFNRSIILLLGLLLSTNSLWAQGGYFSLYHYTPTLNNPAMLGQNAQPSILYNYRHQPVVGGDVVNTHVLTAALPIMVGNKDHQITLGGGVIADNQAQFLKETRGLFALNYSLPISTRQRIGLGVQTGFNQRRVDLSGESTDAQFQNGAFNAGLGLSENLDGANKSYLGVDAGLFWQGFDQAAKPQFFVGLSLLNLNAPNVSFVDDPEDNLPRRWVAIAGYRLLQSGRFSMMPNLRWIQDSDNNQWNAGTWLRYELNNPNSNLGLGAWYNSNESLALSLEFNQSNYVVAAAYNFTAGDELENVMPDGVFEITVGLKLNSKRKAKPKVEPIAEEVVVEQEEEVVEEIKEEVEEEVVLEEVKEEEKKEIKEEEVKPLSVEEERLLARTVRFAYKTNTLDAPSQAFLKEVSEVLKAHPNRQVELAGHTCNWGEEGKNQNLSETRAEAVKAYLLNLGVNPAQVQTKGYGESQPIATNTTEAGRQTNRRVEFKMLD